MTKDATTMSKLPSLNESGSSMLATTNVARSPTRAWASFTISPLTSLAVTIAKQCDRRRPFVVSVVRAVVVVGRVFGGHRVVLACGSLSVFQGGPDYGLRASARM